VVSALAHIHRSLPNAHIVEIDVHGVNGFNVHTRRYNPSVMGAVSGQQTFNSFIASLRRECTACMHSTHFRCTRQTDRNTVVLNAPTLTIRSLTTRYKLFVSFTRIVWYEQIILHWQINVSIYKIAYVRSTPRHK
jgi:hypothetical protein